MHSSLNENRRRSRLKTLLVILAIVSLAHVGSSWIIAMRPTILQQRAMALNMALKHEYESQRWQEITGWVDEPELERVMGPATRDSLGWSGRNFILRLWSRPTSQIQADRDYVREHRDEILALCRARVQYHERMQRKWSWAAWFPWMPVESDGAIPPIESRIYQIPLQR